MRHARPLTREELAALFPWKEAPHVPPSMGFRRAYPDWAGLLARMGIVAAGLFVALLMWAAVTLICLA